MPNHVEMTEDLKRVNAQFTIGVFGGPLSLDYVIFKDAD
jgi:hypothetical protein